MLVDGLKVTKGSRLGYTSICMKTTLFYSCLKIRFVKFAVLSLIILTRGAKRLAHNYHIAIMPYTVAVPSHTHYYNHNGVYTLLLMQQAGSVSLTA